MNLNIIKTRTSELFYVVKSYRKENGKTSSKIVEKLGTYEELKLKLNGKDPVEWAKQYVNELNIAEKENNKKVLIGFGPTESLKEKEQHNFNGGYLFLQKVYHDLGLHTICEKISKKYKFKYNLNEILSTLLYTRIMYPGSKQSSLEESKRFIEQPEIELHQIYRALSLLAQESDYIQSAVYKNSLKLGERKDKVIYYYCTNYYFESEEERGLRQYGYSKEHRPNPIVQMGLFMDMEGIPLAFNINPGNTNEQVTLKPLENKLVNNFGMSKMVVCTDAGLSSLENRKNNSIPDRSFITVQSLKKCRKHIQECCTRDGELAQITNYALNKEMVKQEAKFDGFYAVCTDLEDNATDILKVNSRRWIIEDAFRIMKTEFEARPVFLQGDDRIKAHLLTCFLALVLYKYLEKKINRGRDKFSVGDIIGTLTDMNFLSVAGEGYIPTYTRTNITNALHGTAGFRIDTQIVAKQRMKKIISETKKSSIKNTRKK